MNTSSTSSKWKNFWYCFTSAFFGSTRMRISASLSRLCTTPTTGRRPTNSGMSPNFSRSSGSTSARKRADVLRARSAADVGAEADAPVADARLDDLVETGERTTTDEQDVRGVDLDELLVRVLAPALGRHRRGRAFEDLEQRLLHALTRHVARDRRVLGLAGDLVDLVDVDDAGLGLLDVVVGGLDQLQEDVLDVLADVARLR